ncbi:hypothetical protein [Acinetobacter sp. Marseille-Q1618]|uniref:hypothetical protein n=1 Tax=Acinetobacter sp. Marseille-Q1618 TaxID=2697502 RepID=UPI00156DAE4C|nr:hypothetical protein [Acinetobacter sp. Marseille-Q1618]
MNAKLNSIKPSVTHRVPTSFLKVAAATSLFAFGAISLAFDHKATEYKPPLASEYIPSTYAVQTVEITSMSTGYAVIQLDDFTVKFPFSYEAHKDNYGVPGSDFTTVEIKELGEIKVFDDKGNPYRDFTDQLDHRNFNNLLIGFIEKNHLVEAV